MKKTIRFVANPGVIGLALIAAVSILSCSGGSGSTAPVTPPAPPPTPPPPPPPPPPAPVGSISLDYPTPLLVRGETIQLQPVLKDASGNNLSPRTIGWTSSDPSVVSVSASSTTGNLIAGVTGTAMIIGTIENQSASATATVISFSSIAVGMSNVCATTPEGKLYCAGLNYGPRAQLVAPSMRFSALSLEGDALCGLASDGSAYCWGANSSGQLGTGDTQSRLEPTKVSGNLQFAGISVGRDYACGVTSNGAAYCWGDNASGQLGTGSTTRSMIPVAVQGDLRFKQIEAGSGTTCGITTTGRAWCWGRNDLGQLGTGDGGRAIDQVSLTPVPVAGPLNNVAIKQIVTRGPKTCALTLAGQAWCWGNHTVMETGSSPDFTCAGAKPCRVSPGPVATSATFSVLSATQFATCGITTDNSILCWGLDFENQFGAQGVPSCPTSGATYGCTAAPVNGPTSFVTLSGGRSNYCGIKQDGVAYCWGGNGSGQRGWGASSPNSVAGVFAVAPDAQR